MNILTYKGYQGRFVFDPDADIFHGDVLHINDVITFQGRSIDELKKALADSVEDYLEFCAEKGKTPEKPCHHFTCNEHMNDTMTYKGCTARIVYSAEDECLVGHLINIKEIVGFHGDSVAEIRKAFEDSVNFYLETR